MVTRNDVAKLANVSPAVVSYVLNNSNYVSEAKRKAVMDAIEKLNYIPNQNAKNLKESRTYMIAIIRGSQMNDMFNDLLFYLENIANEGGYIVSLITTARHTDTYLATDEFVNKLISRRYDAIFVANSSMTEQQINRIAASGIKVLLYVTRDYRGLDARVSRIIPDYKAAVKTVITKLIEAGHTRIAFFPNTLYPSTLNTSDNHRFAGYLEALAENGIFVNDQYTPEFIGSIEDAVALTEKLFDPQYTDLPPTAIYVDETIVSASILKKLNALGYRVPEDVSLVCSSSSTMATITTPSLTATGFDAEQFATTAFEMIQELIDGQSAKAVHVEMKLYDRDSIAPPSH